MHKNENIRSAAKRSSDSHACAPLTGSGIFFKEFWKWPKWLLFARASKLGGYNHKHGHLLNHCTKFYLDKTHGYFLFGGVVYLAIVGYIVYVYSG